MLRQSIGDIAFGTGKIKDAIENQTVAAAALERLASEPDAKADLITEAAVAYETLGDEYGQPGTPSMGDIEAAFQQYRKGVALDAQALTVDPAYFRARRGTAVLQMKMGNLQLNNDPETARDSFLAALKMFDQLPEKEAGSLSSRRIQSTLFR
jgi:hypothetical protein